MAMMLINNHGAILSLYNYTKTKRRRKGSNEMELQTISETINERHCHQNLTSDMIESSDSSLELNTNQEIIENEEINKKRDFSIAWIDLTLIVKKTF